MKTLLLSLAALCLGTVGLASSAASGSYDCDRSGARPAPASAFGFEAIGTAGRWTGSPM